MRDIGGDGQELANDYTGKVEYLTSAQCTRWTSRGASARGTRRSGCGRSPDLQLRQSSDSTPSDTAKVARDMADQLGLRVSKRPASRTDHDLRPPIRLATDSRYRNTLTSRRMVKQAEHCTVPLSPPFSSNVAWKKFCVVFSNACTEKFSQYDMTLRSTRIRGEWIQKMGKKGRGG